MGYTFMIACHKCKERAFAIRGYVETVLKEFCEKHHKCGKENKSNIEIGFEIFNDVHYNNPLYKDVSKELHPEEVRIKVQW